MNTIRPDFSATAKKLWRLIGNTPVASIRYRYRGGPEQSILAKCEYFNMTGSIKDRMALYILEKAHAQGKLRPGDIIVEATSGNTGIALAAIGRALGHRVRILMPDWMSLERREMIRGFGAEIQLVSKEQGGFVGSIQMAEAMSFHDRVFLTRQFENQYNVDAHEQTTGREIGYYLLLQKIRPDAFVAGVGTGGTVMGVGKYLRILFPNISVHPLEPAESPTLSTGYQVGSHRIQGISDEFIPAIVDLPKLDQVVRVSDGDAILMAQRLFSALQLPVGISSGANLLGAIKLQQELGPNSVVVTVFPDNDKRYLSTGLFGKEPVRNGYLSPDIELTGCQLTDRGNRVK
ncbi:PLP-dependent cysteine synthase family protein [Mucilaginibacter sp. dw_454]|uniref:PLP-dependent cysteine synthase family protein n=1 Tax=Mucilaginibacter sp. dw_454 TaxID=2720079 RepID=UPI002105D20A|nr:PLP-dependent cysteine synthase family protein [Mucilaginibacter sp. dw_454]